MQDKQTAVINTAVIVIGSYHLPASVAIGALVGASLFILGRQGYRRRRYPRRRLCQLCLRQRHPRKKWPHAGRTRQSAGFRARSFR